MTALWEIIACGLLALIYGIVTSKQVLAADAGTARMQEISSAVQEGAFAFLRHFQSVPSVVSWTKATGYIPTTHGAVAAMDRDFYPKNPGYRVVRRPAGFVATAAA